MRSSEKVVSRSAGAQRQSFLMEIFKRSRERLQPPLTSEPAAESSGRSRSALACATPSEAERESARKPPLAGTVHERDLQTRLT